MSRDSDEGAGARPAGPARGDLATELGPAISIRALDKSFGGQHALKSVDLDIPAGEVHALVGHNGSGKSTLIKVLAGYHVPDGAGNCHVQVNRRQLRFGSPRSSEAAGLRFVHQDLGLVGSMSVNDNLRLRVDGRHPIGRIDRKRERADAQRRLSRLGYSISPEALVNDLSEAERTAVALARCLDGSDEGTSIVVLDEVTASMPRTEATRLFKGLRELAARGTTIIFVSHDLHEVVEVADRVTVLRDGSIVTSRRAAGIAHADLVEMMFGRALASGAQPKAGSHGAANAAVLEVDDLGGGSLESLSFRLHAGRVLGVAGLTGSGREGVADLLAGAAARRGQVSVAGAAITPGSIRAAKIAGLCYVPADRLRRAVLTGGSVRENATAADLRPFWRRCHLSARLERQEVQDWIHRLGILSGGPDAGISTLSGGNQQKVILARWLRARPKVLVLDEPTQGVDVAAAAEVHRLIRAALGAGMAAVVCSSDAVELTRLCDEVAVLYRGQASSHLQGDDVTEDNIETHQLGPLARHGRRGARR
jgi:ribose transport system ATP-binding protein